LSTTDWKTAKRDAIEILERAKKIHATGIFPEAIRNAIVSGELFLKAMLMKENAFRETGKFNDKTHNHRFLWDRVKKECKMSPTTIGVLEEILINREVGKGTLEYINRTASTPHSPHADCADLPSTVYPTDDATPYDLFSESYSLEKIQLAERVKAELIPYL
jgi:HEPN domain-containing protein